MNTIIISAVIAVIICVVAIIVWQTQWFKKLREKNRQDEVKEQDKLKDNIPVIDVKPNPALFASSDVGVYTPTFTSSVTTVTSVAETSNVETLPLENPPKVRVELRNVFDYVRDNIHLFKVEYTNDLTPIFSIYPATQNEEVVKNITIKNNILTISELNTSFTLITKETELFSNLAKEEFERRAIEESAVIHEKLKKFAERLPRAEKSKISNKVVSKTPNGVNKNVGKKVANKKNSK